PSAISAPQVERLSGISWMAGPSPATNDWRLKRDHQQRVDLLAVEDDGALDEAERGGSDIDAVEVAAGGEELAVAIMHDAHGEEVAAGLGDPAFDPVDPDGPD